MDEETQVDVNTENHEEGDGSTTEDVTKQGETNWEQIAKDQRARAEKAEAKLKQTDIKQDVDPEEISKQVEARLRQSQEEEYLAEKAYPDEIKEEIKALAQVKNLSVRKVEQMPYVQSLIQDHERAERVANASTGTDGTTSYKFDPSTPPDVDVSTEEGQKAIAEWERNLERHHAQR